MADAHFRRGGWQGRRSTEPRNALYVITAADPVPLTHAAGVLARLRPLIDAAALEQLRLAARAGVGLEDFYGRLGWKEIGRWPGALRPAPGDDRDEFLMALTL